MSKAARRLHTTGGILFLLAGIVHTVGQILSSPSDARERAVVQSMREYVVPGAGYSYWDVFQCWGFLYAGTTIAFGVLLLAAPRSAAWEPRVIRATALAGVLAALVQTAIALCFRAPPPTFFMIPAAIVLGLAAWRPGSRAA